MSLENYDCDCWHNYNEFRKIIKNKTFKHLIKSQNKYKFMLI